MSFLSTLQVTEHDTKTWVLLQPLIYQGRDEKFVVPEGFVTDFASVPRIFWSVIPRYGRYTKAAVVHDWLYSTKQLSRKDTDGIFKRIMQELGVRRTRRYLMWAAVRVGGWFPWNRGG